jgi:hypothetical protein
MLDIFFGGLMFQLAGFAATGIVVLIILIFTRASKAKPAGAGPRRVLMGLVESSAAGVALVEHTGSW